MTKRILMAAMVAAIGLAATGAQAALEPNGWSDGMAMDAQTGGARVIAIELPAARDLSK